jgi:hypothetical protein
LIYGKWSKKMAATEKKTEMEQQNVSDGGATAVHLSSRSM